METSSASVKQRSPWLYVLLGCGGLAGLICIGTLAFVFLAGKALKDLDQGRRDPEERKKIALKQLGAIPEGYSVADAVDVFLMQATQLVESQAPTDGGFAGEGRQFSYFRMVPNDNNSRIRDFFAGKEDKLPKSGNFSVDMKDIVKRGKITIGERRYSYVASRGRLANEVDAQPGLINAILFECPGEALHLGIWGQFDPLPGGGVETIDLAGTVADEEQLVRFLTPMNPCGR